MSYSTRTQHQIDQFLAVRNNFEALLDYIQDPDHDKSDIEDYVQQIIEDCDGRTGLIQAKAILRKNESPAVSQQAVAGFGFGVLIAGVIAAIL